MKTSPSYAITIVVTLFLALISVTATSQNTAPPLPQETFAVSLYHTGADSIRNLLNSALTVYDNNFSPAVDDDDLLDDPCMAENIAITRDGFILAVELRPIIQANDTMPLFMEHMNVENYEFEFNGSNFSNPALIATLVDNYTGLRTILSIGGDVNVQFSITPDPASSAPGRFMIVFTDPGILPISGLSVNASQKTIANVHGIQVEWVAKTETGMNRYELERSANGTVFNKLAVCSAVGNCGGQVKYNWFDTDPLKANNFYRVKAIDRDGSIKYSSIVKMNIAEGSPAFNIYPNPVTGDNFHLQLNAFAKGTYTISIINNSGQQVFSAQFQHGGGSATQTIELKNKIPAGIYKLQVFGAGIDLVAGSIRISN